MNKVFLFVVAVLVSGCQALPPQQCSATAIIGGQETDIPIYGVRTQANQTQYYAGNPFGWKWVSKSNFSRTTCGK